MKIYFAESATADNYIMISFDSGIRCSNCAPDGCFVGVDLYTDEDRTAEMVVSELAALLPDLSTDEADYEWLGDPIWESINAYEAEQNSREIFDRDAFHEVVADKEEMKMYKIECEIPDYDPDLASNGGSYCQPSYKVLFADGTHIVLADDSCGDFGSEVWVSIIFPDGSAEECHYGSLLTEGQEYSTITQHGMGYFTQIVELCSYHPPISVSR